MAGLHLTTKPKLKGRFMNMEDFQEKMDPTHRMYLCRMLGIKETALLPEDLLGRYAQVKRLVDRIDGHLTPGDLAMIIVNVGDSPEIATELVSKEGEYQAVGQPLDESNDKVIEETVEQPVEPPVSGATGQVAEKTAEPPVDEVPISEQGNKPPLKSEMLWSPGMPVNVLQADELLRGRIVGIVEPAEGSGKAVKLTVEIEGGETITVEEDEVEAI